MSGRLLSARLQPLARRALQHPATTRQIHHNVSRSTGGLLRSDALLRASRPRMWPMGSNSVHNLPAVRNASFFRIIPKVFLNFVRIPALFGGAAIASLAWIQYQAQQAGNFAKDVFTTTTDTVGGFASSIFGTARETAEQMRRGLDNTKEDSPDWLKKILRIHQEIGERPCGEGGEGGGGGGGGSGGQGPQEARVAAGAAVAGSAAAYGYDQSPEEDDRTPPEAARDDQMMVLTKKMIEIRSILQTIGQSETLVLPSIVVIGSQSSGKSSVLEAIVGHEFLPKGSNMVTRRPIELTLVNTPDSSAEYGEFPALGLGKITDFSHIQRTLTELNLAVPDSECVSDDPIQLTISSPHVPDLSLIDLPGYIQVVGQGQPLELKQKISDLCDKYIQPPNIILAISAADVDLANSTALRASRRVDPRGERTIGVVTKMDLVDPVRGNDILNDQKYPLRLGYVGVVCKVPQTAGLFKKGSANITSAIVKNEHAYFSAHPREFSQDSGVAVGTTTLRKKLMQVLEKTMAASLQSTSDAIQQELEEATYEFKVQYNDRPLSAESYLAESLDAFKHSFKAFAEEFGRPQVKEILKAELDQKVLDILAARYWNKPITSLEPPLPEPGNLADLPKAEPDSLYWHRKLDASTSALTKVGIGRLATTVVANAIQAHVDRLVTQSTFSHHPFARQTITEAASGILNERFYSTSDQVENCIKPYKFEIDVEDSEWAKGRVNAEGVLKRELMACERAQRQVEEAAGGRKKLRDVMNFVDKARRGEIQVEGSGSGGAGGFSAALIRKGEEAVFLRDRADILRLRTLATRSKQCASLSNKYHCPEIFLDVVASKLTQTAVLFLNVELLSEFYYNFPRELDRRLGKGLKEGEVERFAREDPKVRGHLEVIRRKELLELVLHKMESLREIEGTADRDQRRRADRDGRGRGAEKERKKSGWGIF